MADKKKKTTKPNEEKAGLVEHKIEKSGFTQSLGEDRSLQAFKDWINRMYSSISPNAEENDTTEEEWVKDWKEFWAGVDRGIEKKKINGISVDGASESKKTRKMITGDHELVFAKLLRKYQEAELPSCTHCGSADTADVNVGIIGLTMSLSASTKKFKLVPNMKDKLGNFFCNECEKFFG